MYWIAIIILLLLLAVLSMMAGRRNHPKKKELLGWSYAHRGLHKKGVPENSMAAFRAALDQGFGIELDIHLMKDGNLAIIHDSSLKRTAGADVKIEDLTAEDLPKYHLEGTRETIPLLSQLLELYQGKAPLIIELKPERNNYAQLCRTACAAMEGYEGPWCMESFDPRCIWWLRKNRPEILRGQLAYDYIKSKAKLNWLLKILLTFNMLNFLTRPDFIAYECSARNKFSNTICRKLWGILGVTWTLRSKADYDDAAAQGWLPIFENFVP